VAFLLVYGWWGWRLWQLTGNPFFPALNSIFHSDWYPEGESLLDTRFGPKSLRRAFLFPFYWMTVKSVGGGYEAEFRFLFAYGTICVWGLFFILYKIAKNWMRYNDFNEELREVLPRVGRLVLIFVIASYLIWMFQFSILRYLVPVSCLLGISCFVCIFSFYRKAENWRRHVIAISHLTFFALASLLSEKLFFAGDTLCGTEQFIEVEVPVLRENTLVLAELRSSFLVPMLHKKNPTVKYNGNLCLKAWNWTRTPLRDFGDCELKREIVKAIRDHRGPICVLAHRDADILPEEVSPFGVFLNKTLFTRISINKGEEVFNLYHADNQNAGKEMNADSLKYFIENVMKNTLCVTHEDFHLFTAGVHVKAWKYWKEAERDYIWFGKEKFGKEKTTVEILLKNPEKLKRILTIKGRTHGRQRALIKVNGREIFFGEVPADGFKELIVPEEVLHVGVNQVEFNWPDARPVERGDNRIVAFAFEKLFLE
jgi:hypothetical protein